jgi:uncharacterized protein YdeI (YjbR/CyaY-like superfamily)
MSELYPRSVAELRAWLATNHDEATLLWVGFWKKGSGESSITYHEALDQALCYGWIDGVRQKVDARRYRVRFTPRKPGSAWSKVNITRARELVKRGDMAPAGLREFEKRDEKAAERQASERARPRELAPAHEKEFRASKTAWAFFSEQPPSYRRLACLWVSSAKQEETQARRLGALIKCSARGERVPQVVGKAAK